MKEKKDNNRLRILALIGIFIRKSSFDKRLSINEIIALLQNAGFESVNRKTLYEDIRALSEYGLDIEYANKTYFLQEAPFSLSEAKVIIDSLESLKNIDYKQLNAICGKIYHLLSEDDEKFLKAIDYPIKHRDLNFLGHLEDMLYAIRQNLSLIITRKKKKEEIFPIYLHRSNDFYYLYYHYPSSNRIYHFRLENILELKIGEAHDEICIPKSEIISNISASTNSFYSKKATTIRLVFADDEVIHRRLEDDFPNIVFTKDGASIKASFNEALMGKLATYGNKIKISHPQEMADKYLAYLKEIIESYLP